MRTPGWPSGPLPGRRAMPPADRSAWPPSGLRLPRRTIRMRLTLLYGGLFLVSGAGLLAITYLLVLHNAPVVGLSLGGVDCMPNQVGGSQPAGCPHSLWSHLQGLVAREHAAELHLLLTRSGIALAFMAVASIALGWMVAGRVLRPLRTITTAARSISARNLHERLALAGPDDELRELGDTFNQLLARLESSFRAQRQFVANASHELRTPLNCICSSPDPASLSRSWP